MKRARSSQDKSPEDKRVLVHLHELLSGVEPEEGSSSQDAFGSRGDGEEAFSGEEEDEDEQEQVVMPEFIQRTEESLAIDDAENPLQLLARASYIQPSPESRHGTSPQIAASASPGQQTEDEIHAFFAPARVHLDVGDDVDPVALGLVSDEEVDSLFTL